MANSLTTTNIDYLSSLNEQQLEAVTHEGSPLLILAGAGSGKTRVITTKIGYLIREKNIEPYSLLAVTFTKKAAKEMQERAVAIEPRAEQSQIRTFHSFGAWFLRKYADDAGLARTFTVYDDDDVVTLISKAAPSLTRSQASKVAHQISLAKDYCLTPQDDLSAIDDSGELNELYDAYEKRLRSTGNADFGDLIMLPTLVMERDEQIRARMNHRFRVIMVDEYQDSNVAQFKLLQTLSGVEYGNDSYVCVVGDDDQSIYKFRGAEVQNILTFADFFPDTKIVRLEQNYRSTEKILFAANTVVKQNESRLGKNLVAVRGEGKKPVLVYLPNQEDEAKFCAELIRKTCGIESDKKTKYSDWAILYRTNAQSLSFEQEFLRQKIPYTVVGSLKFYEREEIKDMLAFLSLIANSRDEIAFRRIVNKPAHGVGEKTQDTIVERARAEAGETTGGAADAAPQSETGENDNDATAVAMAGDLIKTAMEMANSFTKKTAAGIKEFCAVMEQLSLSLKENSLTKSGGASEKLSAFVAKVAELSGLLEYHRGQDEISGTQREANIQELANAAAVYAGTLDGLLEFLDSIELDRALSEENLSGEKNSVTLITLHNTKGLEFPRVIITGMEQGVFPRGDKAGGDLEEERRLFYVGITRAQDELYVTSCAERRMYGRTEMMMPSVFLEEAGKSFHVLGKPRSAFASGAGFAMGGGYGSGYSSYGKREFNKTNPHGTFGKQIDVGIHGNSDSRFAELAEKYAKGVIVYHDEYGTGQIVSAGETGGEYVITVQFENSGKKKFLPQYQGRNLMIVKE